MRRDNRIWILLSAFILLAIPCSSPARVNVVTLPGRDSVQLTIYNSVDLTMVKETRLLTFRKGMNRLEFSWANTLIDPTSVEFKALTHADEVEVLDVRFPPRVSNTLEWHVQSEVSGEVQVEISYFTSGVSWAADYVAEVAQSERSMTLAGAVKITNKSGEDYENAQVRLVVGVIRLVEQIVALSRLSDERREYLGEKAPVDKAMMYSYGLSAPGQMRTLLRDHPAQVSKESVSEYYLYTVEGRDTIPDGWSKKLPSFSATNVLFTSYYKYEKEQYGEQVNRYYTFTNGIAGNLGREPLPDGKLEAFRLATPDRLYAYQGSSAFKYIPINDNVELNLGPDSEVMIKPRMTSWSKQDLRFENNGNVSGWTITENWELELQNSKGIPVTADIRRNFNADWSATSPTRFEKLDANKIKFNIPLAAHSKQTLSYQVVTRHGTNATR
ncbi:MAG: hypothetical protein JWM04_26 [Verrucomicrobiales bacterium]|nr:hypothetical protein [Verrucomicrobiales bacterium]